MFANSSVATSVVIYEWNAWQDYLLPRLFPTAFRILARFPQTAAEVVRALPANASVFFFHINLSDTSSFPLERRALIRDLRARGLYVVNAEPTSTLKTSVGRLCSAAGLVDLAAPSDGDPNEPLIIKTDHNYGGLRERQLTADMLSSLHCSVPTLLIAGPADYRVLPRRSIASKFWRAEGVRIERFVSNAQDVFYRAYVCGDHLVLSRAVNAAEVKKMKAALPRENYFYRYNAGDAVSQFGQASPYRETPNVLSIVIRFLVSTRLRYGAIDIVIAEDEQPYVVDVNMTPYWGDDVQLGLIEHLQRGGYALSARGAAQ